MENNQMDAPAGKGISGILKSVGGLLEKITGNALSVVILILSIYCAMSWWNESQARKSEREVKDKRIEQQYQQITICDSENRELQNRYNELQNSLLRKNGIIDTIKAK